MIELTYADVHQYAVMVILMNALVTLIAVAHSYPLLYIALHTLLGVFCRSRQPAVIRIAAGIVGEDEVVEDEGDGEFPWVGAVRQDEGQQENEMTHEDCIFGIYHIDYTRTII